MFKPNPDYDAETYFSSINSMAKRIVMDTTALQSAHGEKWKNLQYSDQHDLITKNFMKPAITEKYPNVSSSPDENCFPKLKIISGQKFVCEEENANRLRAGKSWRDEYSAPFMWESQSQLNLSYILQETTDETQKVEEIKTEEVSTVSTQQEANEVDESKEVKTPIFQNKDEIVKRSHSKKKAAPPIPTPTSVETEEENATVKINTKVEKLHSPISKVPNDDDYDSSEEAGIPKTGFDFLDNW